MFLYILFIIFDGNNGAILGNKQEHFGLNSEYNKKINWDSPIYLETVGSWKSAFSRLLHIEDTAMIFFGMWP